MNRTETVQAILWLDQVAANVKAESTALRALLMADARAEYEEQGTAPTWRIPDVATVAASVSHESAYVSDPAAFLKWVCERYPTEVQEILQVRPAFESKFLGEAQMHGDDPDGMVAVDPSTGEIVPGVSVKAGGNFAGISIRATADAKNALSLLAAAHLEELLQGFRQPKVIAS